MSISLPVVKPPQHHGFIEALIGGWIVRRDRVVLIGLGVEFDNATLNANISKMPWLEQIVVECKSVPVVNNGVITYEFESSVSDAQIETLHNSFPKIKIAKTGWVNP